MLIKVLFLFLFFLSSLPALTLKSDYIISSNTFMASDIDPSIKDDFVIFTFESYKHHKSFNASKLQAYLDSQGLKVQDTTRGIIHVKRKSSADFSQLKLKVKNYYLEHYPKMDISDISFKQGNFISSLPKDYHLIFKTNGFLYSKSSLQIATTKSKKRIFISYEIKAHLKVFKASHNINRGKIISQSDLRYKQTDFKRFKGLPLQTVLKGSYRLKKRLAKGKILYQKDIEPLPLVLKGEKTNVRLITGSVHLEFQATCKQDGNLGDEVTLIKDNGKRFKAKVISRNLVEIQ